MSGPIKPQDRLAWHRQLSRDGELSDRVVRFALNLSNYFNNGSGECHVGMERLAREARVSLSTAHRSVAALAKRGHVRVTQGGGRGLANVYTMVVRDPFPPSRNPGRNPGQNPVTSDRVSSPKPCQNTPVNPVTSDTPTLKENSKKESRLSTKEETPTAAPGFTSNQGPAPGETSSAPAARVGSNGHAILKVGAEQWQAWLRYHRATGNKARASFMCHMGETSRWGEWQEPTEWPPDYVAPRALLNP